MKSMKRIALPMLAAGAAALLPTGYSQAAITGQIQATLVVDVGCEVTQGSSLSGNINDFGILDFGQTGPIWSNALSAELTNTAGGGSLEVTCDSSISGFNVSIDGGQRGNRTLAGVTAPGNTVAYDVYQDPARSTPYEKDTPVNFPSTGTAVPVPVYGAIEPGTAAADTYKDTLLVTLDF